MNHPSSYPINLAVHHQCFKNKKATIKAIEMFLSKNSEVPYFLVSDSGSDYTKEAKYLGVKYYFSELNVGYRHYSVKQALELFRRVRKTALESQARLILWMEDDVKTVGKVSLGKSVNSTCLPTKGNILWPTCISLLKDKYQINPKQNWWGMAGGSALNGDLFRDKWHLIEEFIHVDYPYLISSCGPKVGHGDILFQMVHLIAGIESKSLGYVMQNGGGRISQIKNFIFQTPLIHGCKEFY